MAKTSTPWGVYGLTHDGKRILITRKTKKVTADEHRDRVLRDRPGEWAEVLVEYGDVGKKIQRRPLPVLDPGTPDEDEEDDTPALAQALAAVDVAGIVARLQRDALAGDTEAARLLLELVRERGTP